MTRFRCSYNILYSILMRSICPVCVLDYTTLRVQPLNIFIIFALVGLNLKPLLAYLALQCHICIHSYIYIKQSWLLIFFFSSSSSFFISFCVHPFSVRNVGLHANCLSACYINGRNKFVLGGGWMEWHIKCRYDTTATIHCKPNGTYRQNMIYDRGWGSRGLARCWVLHLSTGYTLAAKHQLTAIAVQKLIKTEEKKHIKIKKKYKPSG